MATCKYCTKKGWFLAVDGNGLCTNCSETHSDRIIGLVRIADQSVKTINKTAKAETLLSRVQDAKRACNDLLEYDQRGIPTLGSASPREWIAELERVQTEAIEAEIRDAVFMARERSADASTAAAKLSPYARSIDRLTKLIDYPDDISSLELAIERLRRERDEVRIRSLIKKAEVWLAKDKPQKAIEVLKEAQVELIHDTTDDTLQRDLSREIEDRISEITA